MQRIAISLGTLVALMAITPGAEAGSYSFSIGGHRFQDAGQRRCRNAAAAGCTAAGTKT